jgi:hypothetical protein
VEERIELIQADLDNLGNRVTDLETGGCNCDISREEFEALNASHQDLLERVIILEGGCPERLTKCGENCVDLNTDKQNCGQCENICPGMETCIDGQCTLICPEELTNCGGLCVDLETDEEHCGGCGNECLYGQECIDGVCADLPPDIRAVNPDTLPVGTTVSAYGEYLHEVSKVILVGDMGSNYEASFTRISGDQIDIIVSAGMVGEVFDVTVLNMVGSDTLYDAFEIIP